MIHSASPNQQVMINVSPLPDDQQPIKLSLSLKDKKKLIIKQIAIATLKELIISLAFTGAACLFVATPAIPTLLATTIAVIAMNILIRTLTGALVYDMHRMKKQGLAPSKELQACHDLLQYLCPISFTILDTTTRAVLIHEGGHALAASLLYQNARPTIEIFPLKGGVTTYWPRMLSNLGLYFGSKKADLIISAAGPAAGILTATIDLGLAHCVRKKHPELHRYLVCTAAMNIFQHSIYALSAFFETNPFSGHDFFHLWKGGGIHPIVSVISMVALPLILRATLFGIDYCRHKGSSTSPLAAKKIAPVKSPLAPIHQASSPNKFAIVV